MFTNPFPFRLKDGRTILDERCTCGRKRTEHAPGRAGAFGHGPCAASKCPQFTWTATLYEPAVRK